MLEFARWITERDYRAALMAAGLALLPLLAPLSCAVLALAALQRGPVAGWRAAAAAAVLLALIGWAAGMHPLAAVISAVTIWAPTLAVTQLLMRTGSLSAAARLATFGALALAGTWALAAPAQGEPWESLVNELVGPLASQAGVDATLLAERLLALLPGIMAASLLVVSLGGMFLAMWLHAGLATPGAFGEAFRSLQLGPVVGGIGAAALVAGLLGGPPAAIRDQVTTRITVEPGQYAQNDIAKRLYREFKDRFTDQSFVRKVASPDLIGEFLPPGTSKIEE